LQEVIYARFELLEFFELVCVPLQKKLWFLVAFVRLNSEI